MLDPRKIIDWLKLSGKQAFILCVISTILLFGSQNLISMLGLLEAREAFQLWIGLVWLVSASILITEISYPLFLWVVKTIKWRINLKKYQQQLHQLTLEEKAFLSHYVENNTRTASAEYTSGVVKELESANIIRMASNMSQHHTVFPYNIQPWAWEYLNQHPECLEFDA